MFHVLLLFSCLIAFPQDAATGQKQDSTVGENLLRDAQQKGQLQGDEEVKQPAQMTVPEMIDLANQHFDAGRITEAALYFRTSLEQDPNNLDALIGMANCANSREDVQGVRNYLLRAMKIAPEDFRVNFGLGRTYAQAGYWRLAQTYLERAERVAAPERLADVKVLLAQTLRGNRSPQRARDYARAAVDLGPKRLDAHRVLQLCMMDQADYAGARREADIMVQLTAEKLSEDPASMDRLNAHLGSLATKLEVLRAFHNSLYRTDARGNATDEILPNEVQRAAGILAEVIDTMNTMADIQYVLDLNQIIPLAERGVTYAPENVGLIMRLAKLQLNTSHIDAAISLFQQVLELEPGNAEATSQLQALNAPLKREQPAAAEPTPTPTSEAGPTESGQ
jgi:tetratricopeptide (TPR) repeat protein